MFRKISLSPLRFWVLGCLLLILNACKKDPAVEPNRQPGSFAVTATASLNSVEISWTEATDPDDDPVLYTLIFEAETLLTNSSLLTYTATDLDFDREYSGKVIASDDEGLSRSIDFSVRTEASPNALPEAFALVYPPKDSQNLDLEPLLQWEASSDPEGDQLSYDIYLDTNPIPTTLRSENQNNTQYQISGLDEETTYYWKVIAKDGKGGETESETFLFRTRASVSATLLATAPWAARTGHTVLEFNGKLWVIGGDSGSGGRFGDVWSSTDGANWTEEVNQAPWEARTVHSSAVFD
ncbi:MAG: hypothetical protein AAFQ68_08415, partial [Bacteroidota bacterium]